jgi:alpha-galactosidase
MAANLLPFGFDLITIDEGWQVAEALDPHGLPIWDSVMYPSGMPSLAAKIHSMGLRFGLWMVRGIPRAVAEAKLPILGTNYTANEAVRLDRNCSWNDNNFGSNAPSEPASAYYASVANTVASWGGQ